MTKLEKLRKEYRDAFYDLMIDENSVEMERALHNKLRKLENDIQQEQIRLAKRGKKK